VLKGVLHPKNAKNLLKPLFERFKVVQGTHPCTWWR